MAVQIPFQWGSLKYLILKNGSIDFVQSYTNLKVNNPKTRAKSQIKILLQFSYLKI